MSELSAVCLFVCLCEFVQTKPNLTKPCQTKPNHTSPTQAGHKHHFVKVYSRLLFLCLSCGLFVCESVQSKCTVILLVVFFFCLSVCLCELLTGSKRHFVKVYVIFLVVFFFYVWGLGCLFVCLCDFLTGRKCHSASRLLFLRLSCQLFVCLLVCVSCWLDTSVP